MWLKRPCVRSTRKWASLPSNMDALFEQKSKEACDLLEREERCRKALKAVTKAIAMRLLMVGLLFWVMVKTRMELWVIGMMLLVLVINVAGILPLAEELKKRRAEWKQLLAEEE